MRNLHVKLLTIVCVAATSLGNIAWAGPKTKAAQEATEYLLGKFSKEAAEVGAEKLAARLEAQALKYGDDVFTAARRAGPRGVAAVEAAGEQGARAASLLSRQGDSALWIVENPVRLRLCSQYGDEAAEALMKHRSLAEPLVEQFHAPAAKALAQLDGQNARRLATMAEDGELSAIGRSDEMLAVVGKFGDRAMEFIWRNKKTLAVGSVAAAFLANPQPFIEGTVDLAGQMAEKVGAPVASEVARRADWTWVLIAATGVLGVYGTARYYLRLRMKGFA